MVNMLLHLFGKLNYFFHKQYLENIDKIFRKNSFILRPEKHLDIVFLNSNFGALRVRTKRLFMVLFYRQGITSELKRTFQHNLYASKTLPVCLARMACPTFLQKDKMNKNKMPSLLSLEIENILVLRLLTKIK